MIFCGNGFIAMTIIKQRRRFKKVYPSSQGQSKQPNRTRSQTRMLFVLSSFFLITTLPFCIYLVIRSDLKDLSHTDIVKYQLVNALVRMLLYSNFTFNFFLYFVSGTLFKQEWQRMVAPAKARLERIFRRPVNQITNEVMQLQNIQPASEQLA
jgi:hypothetical protein